MNRLPAIIYMLLLAVLLPCQAVAQGAKAVPESAAVATPDTDEKQLDAKAEMDLFYGALKLARDGNILEARRDLERIMALQPAGAFADDAYYEMARISDEIEYNYSDAIKRYELMAEKFPNARPARRALRRAEYLKNAISSGEERFARYEAVMKNRDSKADPLKQIAEVQKVLDGEQPFALEWEAMLWMAAKYRSLENYAEAIEIFERMEKTAVDQDKKREAMLGRADCLLSMGNIYKARVLFEELAASEGFAQKTAGEKLHGMAHSATRLHLRYASIASLLLVLMLFLATLSRKGFGKPDSFRPRFEMTFILPIFLAAFIAALQKGQFAWQAIGLFELIAALAAYAAPLITDSFRLHSVAGKLLLFACFKLALLAMLYLVVDFGNLYDQVFYDLEQARYYIRQAL